MTARDSIIRRTRASRNRRSDDKRRLGLQGLRERIELFGGRLRIDTKVGGGTRLEVELPAV